MLRARRNDLLDDREERVVVIQEAHGRAGPALGGYHGH